MAPSKVKALYDWENVFKPKQSWKSNFCADLDEKGDHDDVREERSEPDDVSRLVEATAQDQIDYDPPGQKAVDKEKTVALYSLIKECKIEFGLISPCHKFPLKAGETVLDPVGGLENAIAEKKNRIHEPCAMCILGILPNLITVKLCHWRTRLTNKNVFQFDKMSNPVSGSTPSKMI